MTWIETQDPLTVKVEGRVVQLAPGQLLALPDAQAQRLLDKLPDKVRAVDPTTLCPRCRQAWIWCAICAETGSWVCSCTHPRLALEIAQWPIVEPTLLPGQVVSWDSPLFGRLTGVYLGPVGRRQVKVQHPLTEREAVIPAGWLL